VAACAADAVRAGRDVAAAARWPRLREAAWRMPIGDGACALVGSGCHDSSSLALSVGTSAAVRVLVTGGYTPPPPGLFAYSLDDDRVLLGGAISNGGVVRGWLRSLLQLPADDMELDALLMARPPAAHGLRMLPFLAGERSPHWPVDAAGAVAGLRLATSALDMLQAGMEAVAYRLAILRGHVADAVPQARTLVASGGAMRDSPYWTQLLCDVLGEPLLLTIDPETSSRGAALLSLEAAGVADALTASIPQTVEITPDADRHEAYAAALLRHTRLEALLR
jgi:gluconokinase